eukprot:7390667-Prymnesium_polylepis.2
MLVGDVCESLTNSNLCHPAPRQTHVARAGCRRWRLSRNRLEGRRDCRLLWQGGDAARRPRQPRAQVSAALRRRAAAPLGGVLLAGGAGGARFAPLQTWDGLACGARGRPLRLSLDEWQLGRRPLWHLSPR